jgi:hypothetical protein
VLAVFVVVGVVALLISVIANAPVIFLRLAELRRGEVRNQTPDHSHPRTTHPHIHTL